MRPPSERTTGDYGSATADDGLLP